jgi:diaminopimelate decarboxylase
LPSSSRKRRRATNFHIDKDYLYCERLRVKDIQERIPESPFYLYSLSQIEHNYKAYASALAGMPSVVSYAFKANSNLAILKRLRKLGSGAALVSGNELRLALAAGFDAERTVLNGNGKTLPELALAAEHGVMINVDSEFDLRHIEQVAESTGRAVRVLIRINPDIDPDVHPYVSTGIRSSKFGVQNERLSWYLKRIKSAPRLELVGVHCHLGSTIENVDVFRDAASLMMESIGAIRRQGFDVRYLNIGGGLGIDYERTGNSPDPADLVGSIRDLFTQGITVIIEPGRSIVGNAGVLVTRVIGVKSSGRKNFIVTDGSMAELIRPSLYGAFHHIGFVEPVAGEASSYDVVGPVCESADFLGRDRQLATPDEGTGLAVYDAGAYGFVMSSNYNTRMRPPEYLVDGDKLTMIRRPEAFDGYLRSFDVD